MKPSLRFLALVAIGWAGLRAATLGALPGAEVFRIDPGVAQQPRQAVIPTEFPPLEPVLPLADAWGTEEQPAALPISPLGRPPVARPHYYRASAPVYYEPMPEPMPERLPGQPARMSRTAWDERPAFYSPLPRLDEWTLVPTAASIPERRSSVVAAGRSVPAVQLPARLDRLQLTSWAMLRDRRGIGGPSGIATGGTLGGSQAGARLTYNIDRRLAASLRTSSDVGRRGGEVAAGLRVQPVAGLPLWLTAERRQRLGKLGGGRNAFALFVEGGVYDRPMPWQFSLDAYLQAGVVGFNRRDKFIDGALTMTRPVYRNLSAGLGLWGGAQPGLYRVDAGPRLSYRVRPNVRVHLDYRHKFAGNALPGSGPVATLAADF